MGLGSGCHQSYIREGAGEGLGDREDGSVAVTLNEAIEISLAIADSTGPVTPIFLLLVSWRLKHRNITPCSAAAV